MTVIDGGVSTVPDHVESFPTEVSKFSDAADGYWLAYNERFAGNLLAADPISLSLSFEK
jgi:hypothetical protein